jgi:predicted nucleic acid-binding protein
MLRLVIDTNVLVSAVIRPGSAPSELLRRWRNLIW